MKSGFSGTWSEGLTSSEIYWVFCDGEILLHPYGVTGLSGARMVKTKSRS